MSMVDTRHLEKPERWNGEDKSWLYWRFITRAYLMAALPSLHDLLLERAEYRGASDSVLWAKLTQDEARHSRQLFYGLVLLATGLALDKVQGSGEGPGAAWRAMYEQWNLAYGAGKLLSILGYRFAGGRASSNRSLRAMCS